MVDRVFSTPIAAGAMRRRLFIAGLYAWFAGGAVVVLGKRALIHLWRPSQVRGGTQHSRWRRLIRNPKEIRLIPARILTRLCAMFPDALRIISALNRLAT